MWLANLLTSGLASFGRVFSVNLLPTAVSSIVLWLLIGAGSFTGPSSWETVVSTSLRADAGTVLLFLVAVTMVAVVLQPFQVQLVRLLEGYWSNWPPSAAVAKVMASRQRRRLDALRDDARNPVPPDDDVHAPLHERMRERRQYARQVAAYHRANSRLRRYPFGPDKDLLPTALGNALRAGESTAGERYGLETIYSWPRILPQASPRLAAMANSARDAMDASASLCIHFFIIGVVSAIALYDEPLTLWVPILAFALSAVSYSGAVNSAMALNRIHCAVYDLHRFDMVKALHYRQPADWRAEQKLYAKLNELFKGPEEAYEPRDGIGRIGELYDHGTGDGSAKGTNVERS